MSLSYLQWTLQTNNSLLHGDSPAGYVDTEQPLGIVFPQGVSDPVTVTITSNAGQFTDAYTLANLKFFLRGDPSVVAMLQGWAPAAGMQISFDSGKTWTTFSASAGNPAVPSSWILMPNVAVTTASLDGQLLPNDVAKVVLRLLTPLTPAEYGIFRVSIGCDFDVY